ncbi:hypothetical protein PROFUN_12962 [Planoprotostelium fungivorum]|uniref:Uncharacterized protein n=1 Tax=Planoprotostelium fungivorum TaxID=1890364 RepID=A0A2P6MZI0_9EUKA|nr:hypothetical protein PROFUN_12962 [Planoprotostelium fungivorum]
MCFREFQYSSLLNCKLRSGKTKVQRKHKHTDDQMKSSSWRPVERPTKELTTFTTRVDGEERTNVQCRMEPDSRPVMKEPTTSPVITSPSEDTDSSNAPKTKNQKRALRRKHLKRRLFREAQGAQAAALEEELDRGLEEFVNPSTVEKGQDILLPLDDMTTDGRPLVWSLNLQADVTLHHSPMLSELIKDEDKVISPRLTKDTSIEHWSLFQHGHIGDTPTASSPDSVHHHVHPSNITPCQDLTPDAKRMSQSQKRARRRKLLKQKMTGEDGKQELSDSEDESSEEETSSQTSIDDTSFHSLDVAFHQLNMDSGLITLDQPKVTKTQKRALRRKRLAQKMKNGSEDEDEERDVVSSYSWPSLSETTEDRTSNRGMTGSGDWKYQGGEGCQLDRRLFHF